MRHRGRAGESGVFPSRQRPVTPWKVSDTAYFNPSILESSPSRFLSEFKGAIIGDGALSVFSKGTLPLNWASRRGLLPSGEKFSGTTNLTRRRGFHYFGPVYKWWRIDDGPCNSSLSLGLNTRRKTSGVSRKRGRRDDHDDAHNGDAPHSGASVRAGDTRINPGVSRAHVAMSASRSDRAPPRAARQPPTPPSALTASASRDPPTAPSGRRPRRHSCSRRPRLPLKATIETPRRDL